MNNANTLTSQSKIRPHEIFGKYQAIGRSYGKYSLEDIPAGTPTDKRTIVLPAKNSSTGKTDGTTPDSIEAQGNNPWTYIIFVDLLEEHIHIDVKPLQKFFSENGYFEAYVEIWCVASNPLAAKGLYFDNGENTGVVMGFQTNPWIKIKAFMAKREWIDPTGAEGILMPTYCRPRL